MKKIISFLLFLSLCFDLCACGVPSEKNKTSDEKEAPSNSLMLSVVNEVSEYAKFELFKIETAKKISASIADRIYFENKNDGEIYVDVVLDWTNISAETVNSSDALVLTAVGAGGAKYTADLYAVETNNASYLSQYEAILPLSTVRLHCALSVPETETALTLTLKVNGERYSCAYTMGTLVRDAKSLNPGDTVKVQDLAALKFIGIEYTDDVLPSDTSRSYRHYEIENPSNTYLVVKFDLTNYASAAKRCESFFGLKATYLDKYTYTGFVVVEDEDGRGFSAYEDVLPLSTRHFYCLIEVPKTVMDYDMSLTLAFAGEEYVYTKAP